MDFASTLRVLAKHKVIAGTLLALTLIATIASFAVASKTQEASGSYLLLTAKTPPRLADGTQISTNNPFADMELSTVVDVLVRAQMTDKVANELKAEGFVGSYTVVGNKDFVRGPVLDLTVTSPTAEEALSGYELLATSVQQTLQDRQLSEGANPDYLVTMQRLQDPVVTSPGLVGRLRLSIAVLAVGLIATLGITFAVESLQNWSSKKHEDEDEDEDEDEESDDEAETRGLPAPRGNGSRNGGSKSAAPKSSSGSPG